MHQNLNVAPSHLEDPLQLEGPRNSKLVQRSFIKSENRQPVHKSFFFFSFISGPRLGGPWRPL